MTGTTRRLDELPGWTFEVDEVSAGVVRVRGFDKGECRLEESGTDPDALLDRSCRAAFAFSEERARSTAAAITSTLSRMAALLRLGGLDEWASSFEALQIEAASDFSGTQGRIHAMYGGMGSLNDIVLHRAGAPLVAENDEFDALRRLLYQLSSI